MKAETTPTLNLSRPRRHIGSLVIMLLAFTVASQAVHAKASHYSKKSTQSIYFSASVKIANLAPSYSATPEYQAIVPVVFAVREQQPTRAESSADPGYTIKSIPITSRLLRSPPETL